MRTSVARLVQVEDPQRQAVVAAHDDRRRVHHVQALVEHLVERQPLVALGASGS